MNVCLLLWGYVVGRPRQCQRFVLRAHSVGNAGLDAVLVIHMTGHTHCRTAPYCPVLKSLLMLPSLKQSGHTFAVFWRRREASFATADGSNKKNPC